MLFAPTFYEFYHFLTSKIHTMKFDAIIIGTGQAGPPLASSLAKNGYKTAIVEKGLVGGSCVNVGCTPTKAYVASARRAFVAGDSLEHVSIKGEVHIDLRKIKTRKDRIIDDSRTDLEEMLASTDDVTLLRGKATFVDNHTISVNGKKYSADKIYINVGTRPRIPEGFEDVPFLTNETILELEEVPERLVIVGGGYIGLEFGQMFRRFGSQVTILEKGNRLFRKEDEDKKRYLSDRFTCYAAFIDPPLARMGMNLQQINDKGIKAKLAEYPMNKVARAKEMGETSGKLKIYTDSDTQKILGASFVGTGADEFIHAIIDQMYAGATYDVMRDAIHIHPTVSELIPTMLESPERL